MSDSSVTQEPIGGVQRIPINCPESRNAFTISDGREYLGLQHRIIHGTKPRLAPISIAAGGGHRTRPKPSSPLLAGEGSGSASTQRTGDNQLHVAELEVAKNMVVNVPMRNLDGPNSRCWPTHRPVILKQTIEFESLGVFMAESTRDKIEMQKRFFVKRAGTFN